jgi:methylmalonyl-CoA mutase
MLRQLHSYQKGNAQERLDKIQQAAIQNKNIFEELMEAGKVCSLGEITKALFEVGGQYRRNM